MGGKRNHSSDWLEFESWFHLRGQLGDFILDARSYNIHFLSAGTGGGTNPAEIATLNVSWIGRVALFHTSIKRGRR